MSILKLRTKKVKNKKISRRIFKGILLSLIAVIFIAVAVVLSLNIYNSKIADEIISGSKLPYKFLLEYNKFDEKSLPNGYDKLYNYMSWDFHTDGYIVRFGKYPMDLNKRYLTEIEITSSEYNILGISPGANYMDAAQKLSDSGWKPDINFNSDSYRKRFEKGRFTIFIASSDDIIDTISIESGLIILRPWIDY